MIAFFHPYFSWVKLLVLQLSPCYNTPCSLSSITLYYFLTWENTICWAVVFT